MTSSPRYIEPNQYELSGGDLSIQYSTTSAAGVPLFSFQHRGVRKSYRGDVIREVSTEIGRLVTVTVDQVADLHTITLTLLVPGMNLDCNDGSMQTFALFTTSLTSIGGPRLVRGQLTRYERIELAGRAQLVVY
jgi:hypothetical protein